MGLSAQVLIFFQACILGFLLGLLYDAFRILRLSFPNGRVLIFLEDVLYFAVAAVVSFSFIVLANGGVLRAFLLFGELMGAILYFCSLSIPIMKAAHWIIRLVHSVLLFLYRITILPICKVFKWFTRKCVIWLRFLSNHYKIIALNHKKHLKPTSAIVYNDAMQSNEERSGGLPANSRQRRQNRKGRRLVWRQRERKKTRNP